MKKTINELNIWIEVTDENGKFIYEGSVEKGMTHEEVYKTVTARYEFRLNGKLLVGYTAIDTFPGERQATLDNLSQEYNCSIEDIEVVLVKGNI